MQLARRRTRQPQWATSIDKKFSAQGSIVAAGRLFAKDGVLCQPALLPTVDYLPVAGGIGGAGKNLSAGLFFAGNIPFAKLGKLVYVIQITWNGDTTSTYKFAGFGNNGTPDFYVEEILAPNIDHNGSASPGNFRCYLRDQSGGVLAFAPTAYRLTANVQETLVIAIDSGTTARIWAKGAQVQVSYGSTGFSPSTTGAVSKEFALYNFNYGTKTSGHSDAQNGNYGLYRCSLFARLPVLNALAPSLALNPWQIFNGRRSFLSVVATVQYARPTSDVTTGAWVSSLGGSLAAAIDETIADDADYISTTYGSVCEVVYGSLADPGVSSGHKVRYRIAADAGGIIVRLRQGATTIASWTHNPAPTSLTTFEQTLSGAEADSITDYTALKIQFEAIT